MSEYVSPVASARLTITMAGGNGESRTLSAYGVTSPYDEQAATWRSRNSSSAWAKAGGDLAARYDRETVTAAAGTKVTFDVTSLVQAVVRGDLGSRYTRVALVDEGASSKGSYKTIHSEEAAGAGGVHRLRQHGVIRQQHHLAQVPRVRLAGHGPDCRRGG